MRLSEIWPLYLDGARELVDVTPEGVDLREALRLPADVAYARRAVEGLETGPETVVLSLVGPDPGAHSSVDALSEALRGGRTGARALVLLGWPMLELPYHLLLGPLVDASWQAVAAVPLDRMPVPDVESALLAERVERLVPLRSYLLDAHAGEPAGSDPGELPVGLRLVNEYVLGDLVARRLRRRLSEMERALDERPPT